MSSGISAFTLIEGERRKVHAAAAGRSRAKMSAGAFPQFSPVKNFKVFNFFDNTSASCYDRFFIIYFTDVVAILLPVYRF